MNLEKAIGDVHEDLVYKYMGIDNTDSDSIIKHSEFGKQEAQ